MAGLVTRLAANVADTWKHKTSLQPLLLRAHFLLPRETPDPGKLLLAFLMEVNKDSQGLLRRDR